MIQASVKTEYNFWGPPNTELGSKDKKTGLENPEN